MNILVRPRFVTVGNGLPFTLTTEVRNCEPGILTLFYTLPPETPCEFVTAGGTAKSVSHQGVIAGTSGTVRATLRVRSPITPAQTTITVTAVDSAGQRADDTIGLEVT
jgi:hypothetical protein